MPENQLQVKHRRHARLQSSLRNYPGGHWGASSLHHVHEHWDSGCRGQDVVTMTAGRLSAAFLGPLGFAPPACDLPSDLSISCHVMTHPLHRAVVDLPEPRQPRSFSCPPYSQRSPGFRQNITARCGGWVKTEVQLIEGSDLVTRAGAVTCEDWRDFLSPEHAAGIRSAALFDDIKAWEQSPTLLSLST